MLELVAETGCGYVLMHIEGPPRVDRPWRRLRRRRRPPEGLVRGGGRAGPRRLASPRSRSRSTPDSTSTSAPSRTWRSCAGSASCARWGGRFTSRCRARTSSARCWPDPGRSGGRRGSASGGRSPRSRWRCARAPTSCASTTAARCRRCGWRGRIRGCAFAVIRSPRPAMSAQTSVASCDATAPGRSRSTRGRRRRRDGRIVAESSEPDARRRGRSALPATSTRASPRRCAGPGSSRSTRTSCGPGRRRRAPT